MKKQMLKILCTALKYYLQYFPITRGKLTIWDKFVSPYILTHQIEVVAKLKNGVRLYGTFPDIIHVYSYFFGVWEPAITAYYKRALCRGDIVIDIGANAGAHALLAADLVGARGRVHAVEASPSIFHRLKRNLDANQAHNVIAYNCAVLDRPEAVPVFLHNDSNLGGTTVMPSEALNRQCMQESVVEGRPLSAIIPITEICAARLIKIDVEGAEWLVVKGMHDVLPRLHRDVEIIIEVTYAALGESEISIEEFLTLFKNYGFTAFQIPNMYSPDFYIACADCELVPMEHREFDLADIVFRRVATDSETGHCTTDHR
jgi:FkbM family methyltransferase